MTRSRLERVRNRRAGKQGVTYFIIAIVLIVVTVAWGLPAIARITGYFTQTDSNPLTQSELRPTPPIFSDIPEATNSARVVVGGFAQPGLDVILYLNGAESDRKLVSESGTFLFDKVMLSEGENTVYGYTATPHALQSEQSRSYIIVIDTTKPIVTLDSPRDGEVMRGQSQRIANFVGSVDELGAKVYIGERMVIVQSDGKFSLPYQLIEGDQEIPIKVIDRAGNENITMIKSRWEP